MFEFALTRRIKSHKCTRSGPAVGDTQAFKLLVGTGNGVEVDPEIDGELPNRGQPLSGLEGPVYDVTPYAVDDLLIQRMTRPVVERHVDVHHIIKRFVGLQLQPSP